MEEGYRRKHAAWEEKRRQKLGPEEVKRRARAALLKGKFGLTIEQYETLLEKQLGVCALCRRPPKVVRLHVDHDHKTGVIRGLLCHRCNRGLGYIQNTPEVLERAAGYVLVDTGYRVPKRPKKPRIKRRVWKTPATQA